MAQQGASGGNGGNATPTTATGGSFSELPVKKICVSSMSTIDWRGPSGETSFDCSRLMETSDMESDGYERAVQQRGHF